MPGRQAKLIAPQTLNIVLRHIRKNHVNHVRSRLLVLLSVRAGLRAAEIAYLDWSMVLGADSRISDVIELTDRISKMGSGRRVPMHRDLRRALVALRQREEPVGPVIKSARGGHMKPNSVVNWFVTLFKETGLQGCSSHSGRRTFITQAARLTHKAGGSLRDVQILAGHRSIDTTQGYIDGDSHAQRKLIALL